MTRYIVTGTVSYIGWAAVDAESEEEAFAEAQGIDVADFEFDRNTGDVEWNIVPQVEVYR